MDLAIDFPHKLEHRGTAMISWHKLRTGWLKARIAYHRRQANSYSRHIARSFRRETYTVWTRNMALRHAMKAHDLERRLLAALA